MDFVADIVRLDIIKEVIIINNDSTLTPTHRALGNPKVRVYSFGKNIMVNPAWNYGANVSTADKICIMNDDIIVDLKLFYRVDDFFLPKHGTIGLINGRTDFGQTPITNGAIGFEKFQDQACYGFGTLFFVHKQQWRDIPSGINICLGDNFVFEYFLFRGFDIHLINNTFHYHAEAKTRTTLTSAELDQHSIGSAEEELYFKTIRPQLVAGTY